MLMTVIISILLLVFGLNPSTGKIQIIGPNNNTATHTKPIDVRAEAARQNNVNSHSITSTPKQKSDLSKTATNISSCYNDAKQARSACYNDTKQAVSSCYNDAKQDISSGYNDAKQDISSGYNDAKQVVSSDYNDAKQTVSSGYNEIKQLL